MKRALLLVLLLLSINYSFSQSGGDSCIRSAPFCGSAAYTFPAGTTGNAEPPHNGCPAYGCLGSQPAPAWYFMEVDTAGNIIISMYSTPSRDIDFIYWGPFTSPTGACPQSNGDCGLTSDKIVDCSYSPSSTETCHIYNAQVGQFYTLLITNYSRQNCNITFQQTNYGQPGAGSTTCNIVITCSMLSLSPVASSCDQATNTFSISGTVEFTNQPATGSLIIKDKTAVPNIIVSFPVPVSSPQAYTLSNIPCDGLYHSIIGYFSDDLSCNLTDSVAAPMPACPVATISGGGNICNNGTDQTTILFDLIAGLPPVTFTYKIDGVLQPPIANYNGPFPYHLLTQTPGTYTLANVSNVFCQTGTVSGSATVVLNPVPQMTNPGSYSMCSRTQLSIPLTSTPIDAATSYSWTVTCNNIPSGCPLSGTGQTLDLAPSANSPTPGIVNYSVTPFLHGCTGSPETIQVTVNPLPIPVISGNNDVCLNSLPNLYSTSPGMSDYQWVVTGGTVVGGGSQTDHTILIIWDSPGINNINLTYTDPTTSCTGSQDFNVTAHTLPIPSFLSGPISVCPGISGNIYITEAGKSNYIWSVSGGTITSGGTSSDNTATITWNTVGTESVSVGYTEPATGCTSAAPTSYAVTVHALPVPTITGNATVCNQSTGNIYTTETGMTGYTWLITGGTITGGGTSTDNTATVTWTSVGPQTISVNYNDANGCTAAAATVKNVTVLPLPDVIATPSTLAICSGFMANIALTSSIPGTTFAWNVPVLPLGVTMTQTSGTGDIHQIINNANTTPVIVNFSIMPTASGCSALSPTIYPVTVNPLPIPTVSGPQSVCFNSTQSYSTQASMTSYIWTVTGGTITAG